MGEYQIYNAAVAIEVAEQLRFNGYKIADEDIIKGLSVARWPARFEVISKKPIIIVDGAHNPDGMKETVKSLNSLFNDKKIIIVMGVMADKDITKRLEYILPLSDSFITVTPNNPRAMRADDLADILCSHGKQAISCKNMSDAAKKAITMLEDNSIICALGSLYMAAEIKKAFMEEI